MSAGADAVYLGLESFNARRGADNFTVRTFEEACAYAHLRGVRVYVTMNTAVLPAEVDEALECARQAYRAGADAFIVQDIGLASEISRTLPEARLHISTQMNTHNEAGLRAAARLGASRVTSARELSLEEIARYLSEVAGFVGHGGRGVRPRRVVRLLLGAMLHVVPHRRPIGEQRHVRPGVPLALRVAQSHRFAAKASPLRGSIFSRRAISAPSIFSPSSWTAAFPL